MSNKNFKLSDNSGGLRPRKPCPLDNAYIRYQNKITNVNRQKYLDISNNISSATVEELLVMFLLGIKVNNCPTDIIGTNVELCLSLTGKKEYETIIKELDLNNIYYTKLGDEQLYSYLCKKVIRLNDKKSKFKYKKQPVNEKSYKYKLEEKKKEYIKERKKEEEEVNKLVDSILNNIDNV